MKLAFRIECPYCKWGSTWRDSYINQGWLALQCGNCNEKFFTKIAVTGVNIETVAELPPDHPPVKYPHSNENQSS